MASISIIKEQRRADQQLLHEHNFLNAMPVCACHGGRLHGQKFSLVSCVVSRRAREGWGEVVLLKS